MDLADAVRKAALLMDLRGDATTAQATLRQALAEHVAPTPERLRAQVFLAELFLDGNHDDGVALLADIVAQPIPESWEDQVSEEAARARFLLSQHRR